MDNTVQSENSAQTEGLALLEQEAALVLSTAGEGGSPAAAALFYVQEGFRIYWLSSPDSRHSRNLAASARASVAVFSAVWDWRGIRGLQMDGRATAVADPDERSRVLASYRRRFALGPELEPAIGGSVLYRFDPSWIRYLDNRRGFGYRAEWTAEA